MKKFQGIQYKIFIYILLLFLCGCFKNSSIKTIKPEQGEIQKSFIEPSKTQLEKTYDINMPISGELERINLEPGNAVKKGQIIARLVQLPLLQAVNKAQAKLKVTESYYAHQQIQLNRKEKLGKGGYITKSALDDIRVEEKVLFTQIEEAKADLEIARYHLKQSTLRSPINGIILKRYTQGGKWMSTGTRLLRIGDLNEMEVIADVLTQEAQSLKIGGPVIFTSIGSPAVLKGKVKRINPAGFTKKSSLGVDEQRVNVICLLEDPLLDNLGVGFRLQAEFFVGTQNKKALLIPRFSVLQDSKENHYVFKIRNDKLQKQIVQIGISTDEKMEIKKGLILNDDIVAQPNTQMYDGMKI